MANGIYSAAAGMAAQQVRLDAIANDLANANTFGYKSERVGFKDLLYGAEQGVPVGSGTAAVDAGRSDAQGALGSSGNPLSLAISGPGYFSVRRADGTTALTRNGSFQLDATGALVTTSGEHLVPPIRVPRGTQPSDVTIATDGTVQLAGRTIGRIRLVTVTAPSQLRAVGDSDFAPTRASGAPTAARGAKILQAQEEESNVDVATAMTDMLDAQQTYSLVSRALQTQDQLAQIANGLKR
ncbi:MAG TPA: flagellar hook-basal body protein [Gaiellales bacterium]|jgi:flagellar basal-body rod protein FlgG|nr:flagellar hook-basal body protein [Gaiellales bacterium]